MITARTFYLAMLYDERNLASAAIAADDFVFGSDDAVEPQREDDVF
jgi:hypothetical protein